MGTSRSTSKQAGQPSERDQFWLDHEAVQVASGQTAKEYAAAQGLSLDSFYQARKRLRALGLLAAAPEVTGEGRLVLQDRRHAWGSGTALPPRATRCDGARVAGR